MTARGERVRRRVRHAEDATVDAIEEGTRRLRDTLRAGGTAARKVGPRARRAVARNTLLDTIRLLPSYLKLLVGLITDRRVSLVDKLLVGAAIAYVVSPLDLVPDWIPFLGQVDDVYLVVTTLQRLIANAGRRVVRSYWEGPLGELEETTLAQIVSSAAVFLPRGIRKRLRRTR